MSTTGLNPRILGQAENAHRALLQHFLAGTGLNYERWVAVTLVGTGGPEAERTIVERLSSALKVDSASATATVADLKTAGLVASPGGELHLTDEGQRLFRRVRASVDETITELYSNIPAGDLEVAGRVLAEITTRANAKLGQLAGSAKG